ncbi:TetR family transcriptional regulator [Henriciella aquimarina]|uniref:TetR family transcriptional regulator n=1 Tax=Henriciella aquimarina TaxID=545261 RepID=UPI000A02BC8A|nr:TetR family transcriptional regulator [Henriciella aquimarina]
MYQSTQHPDPDDEGLLLSQAIAQIESSGLKGLSLRSLAQSAGISPSLLTYRYGSRNKLLAKVFEYAKVREQSNWQWREAALSDLTLSRPDLTSLALTIAQDEIASQTRTALVGWIGQTTAERDTALKSVMSDWHVFATDFWAARFAGIGLDTALAPSFAGVLNGAVRIGLLAGSDLRMKAWMNDILLRLCDRINHRPLSTPGDSAARAALEHSGLETQDEEPEARTATPDRIIDAAVKLILSHGPDSLTHRLIARESGISLSSMTHHFGSLDEIMLRAFQRIYDTVTKESSHALTAHNSVTSLCETVLPAIFGRVRRRGFGGFAMDEVILYTSRQASSAPLAGGLLAMTGRTSTALLQSIDPVGKRADRLDGQIFRFVLTGLSQQSLSLPLEQRERWMVDQCKIFLAAYWPET